MGRVMYTVTATLPDEATAREYVAWLRDGHVGAVVAGGATSGIIVRLDAEGGDGSAGAARVETRYEFADRAAYERYVSNVAPGLRADGLARFGPGRGVRFERRLGEVVG